MLQQHHRYSSKQNSQKSLLFGSCILVVTDRQLSGVVREGPTDGLTFEQRFKEESSHIDI